MIEQPDIEHDIVRVIIRKLIQEAVRRVVESINCLECFGTGLRGGFVVPCSKGCVKVR